MPLPDFTFSGSGIFLSVILAWILLFQLSFQDLCRFRDTVRNACWILAAGLCHVGASATATAYLSSDTFDEIPRMGSLCKRSLSDHGNHIYLPACAGK